MKVTEKLKFAVVCLCACCMPLACTSDTACLQTIKTLKYVYVGLIVNSAAESCGTDCLYKDFSIRALNSDAALMPITWKSNTEFEVSGTSGGLTTFISGKLDTSLRTVTEINVQTSFVGATGTTETVLAATDVPLFNADCSSSHSEILYKLEEGAEVQGHITTAQWSDSEKGCACSTIDYSKYVQLQVSFTDTI